MARPLLQVSALLFLVSGTSRSAPSSGRLSEAEWQSYNEIDHKGPGTYAFGYDVEDPKNGNIQFRQEERHPNGTVTGSYGVVEPDGNLKVVHYIADERGYRVTIDNSKKRQAAQTVVPPDTKVVYPEYFSSMPPPVIGHSYMHIKHRPQYSNIYANYPRYSVQVRTFPDAPLGVSYRF